MVVCDTNILIDYVRQKRREQSVLEQITEKEGRSKLAISILTVQELFQGKSASNPTIEQSLMTLIVSFRVYPYTYEVARRAGEITRERDISFVDAAIAATAIVNGALLATLNKRDFAGIPGLELAE